MKKFPVYPKHETDDNNGEEYDPHAEFSQFLEEAKHSERKIEFGIISSVDSEEDGSRKLHQDEKNKNKKEKKKKKKAWKVFLLPWWKGEKKSKPHMGQEKESNFYHLPKTRRGFASGPVYCSSGKDTDGGPWRRPTSGPLNSLFNTARKPDAETPYLCLKQLNTRRGGGQTYGPVYLVT